MPFAVFASGSLKRDLARSTCAQRRSQSPEIRKAREPEGGERRATPEALLETVGLVQFAGGVEQGVQLVDLEEGPSWLLGREEAVPAFTDLHRVDLDELALDRALHDPAEQREDLVDRGVRERAHRALVGGLVGLLDPLHQGPAESLCCPDHLRSFGEPVAKIVDPFDVDLEQLEMTEFRHEVVQAPVEVFHGLLIETPALDRLHDRPRKWTEQLVSVRPGGARALDARLLGGRHPGAALDFLQDALELDLGPGAVPALKVGAEDQPVASIVCRQPCAEGDRPAVLPLPFCDLACAGSSHQHGRSLAVENMTGYERTAVSHPCRSAAESSLCRTAGDARGPRERRFGRVGSGGRICDAGVMRDLLLGLGVCLPTLAVQRSGCAPAPIQESLPVWA